MLMRTGRIFAVFALLLTQASADDSAAKPSSPPVRVLILTGGRHDWRTSSTTLKRILDDTGRFDVRLCESPAGLTSQTLADFDLVIDDVASGSPGRENEEAIAGFLASGKGLVITHGALARSQNDHPPAYWPATPKGESHPRVQFLDVAFSRPEHPIVKGIKSPFKTADSLPTRLIPTPSAEILATVDGKQEPILIVSAPGSERVLCLALGHDASAMHEKAFRSIFARSAEWAATGTVTLAAESTPSPSKVDQVKALLITGGHDHDAAFYSLFRGCPELDRLPILTSTDAFKEDIRVKYDVIIMYDFTRDLDEPARKNLRDFVEAGGGVVVLHHALLNYQTWTWWDDEAVGGSYRLSNPSSSVKDDQQIYVTPTADHPITSGLAPFHIQDEAYKNLRMSPKIRPLLTTDNPTSDRNLAWVGPLEGSKIVAIQLGHGHTAFEHPSYRALVHNAILWAARKTK